MIKNFIIYKQSGEILRTGTCAPFDYENQAQDGELIMEGLINQSTQYIFDGSVIDLPEKPSQYHEFNYANKVWQLNTARADMDAKFKRNQLLADSDFYDTVSAQKRLSTALFNEWAIYRQALRDVTNQSGYPLDIQWPVPPQ